MVVRKRGLNIKRHTISYLVGNSWCSRRDAVSLAKKGKIAGVKVARNGDVEFITSLRGHTRLYDLPTVVR
jgi:hypothetical protein